MSKRLILTLIATSLLAAACANPVSTDQRTDSRARVSHDQSATPGGNAMGAGS